VPLAAMQPEIHFWAKTTDDDQPGISVRDHCLNVGCVAEALVRLLPKASQDLLPQGAVTLAALHDVGKISPGFQQKCPAWMTLYRFPPQVAETDHAKVSQWFLQRWIGEARMLKRWLMAVGAHHGQSKGSWIKDERCGGTAIGLTGGPEWQEARELLATRLTAFFEPAEAKPTFANGPPANDAVLGLFAGLIAVADWIGSDEHFFSPRREDPPLTPVDRRRRARKAVTAIGLDKLPVVREAGFADLFPGLRSPNPLQEHALNNCHQPGLWIVEAPMGHGKTEAALLAASLCESC
jgi:CRISPR-associated endonuclease/helicase Cas3